MNLKQNKNIREDISNILNKYEKENTLNETEGDVLLKIDYIFRKLKDVYNLPLNIKKEKTLVLLEKNKKGRIDTLINSVVIEYKKPSSFKTENQQKKAIEQARNYINQIKEDSGHECIAYITDSKKIIRIDTYQKFTDNNVLNLNEDIFIDMIEDFFKSTALKTVTSQNLVEDFVLNLNSPLYKITERSFVNLDNIFSNNIQTKTLCLFNEWKELFKLNHDEKEIEDVNTKKRRLSLENMFENIEINNSQVEYETLFSLYTTYALVIKLVAYHLLTNVFDEKSLLNISINEKTTPEELKSFLTKIENGKHFRDCGIFNLMEGDFFTWYLDSIESDEVLFNEILKLINSIQSYYFDFNYLKSNSIDMFRDLYEAFIPFAVRHSLGEYFTPIWLADYCYQEGKPSNEAKIIDNCCGSGAFLIAAINNKKRANRSLDEMLSEVTGIDINPLAVLMARVNYFLNISNLIVKEKESIQINPIVIPIYLADSCNQPKNINGFMEYNLYLTDYICEDLGLENSCIKIKFPNKILQTDKATFFKNIDLYEEEIIKQNIDSAMKIFDSYELDEKELQELYKLTDVLISLESKNWNGIWARIIANRLCTSLLPKQDLVIGNPPWVKWGDLPIRYREELKNEAESHNLFNSSSKFLGANSLNICSLVSFLAGVKYVKPNGKVIYLMPRDLIFQDSYDAWRKLGGKMELEYCIDWETPAKRKKVFNEVSMPFMAYVFTVK